MVRRRVLLTGAAGAIGREALKELVRRDDRYEVTVLDLPTRRVRALLRPYAAKASLRFGDIRSRADVRRAMEGVDAVIHLAAVIPPRADRDPRLAAEVNVEGTRVLIEAARQRRRDMRFIYSSSISVYGDRLENPWIEVGDPLRPSPHDEYAKTKIRAEEQLRGSGLGWSILRLSAVFGPEMGVDPLMFHMPLDTCLEIVTTRDCGYAVVEAIECDEMIGGTYDLGGGPACRTTYRECLDTFLEIAGLGQRFFPEDAFARGNFHCGYYSDSEELDAHLHFQRDTLEDFYGLVASHTPTLQRTLAGAARPLIRWFLLWTSEPYAARRRRDRASLERFLLSS